MGTRDSKSLTQLVSRGAIINAAAALIAGLLFVGRNLIAAAFMGPAGMAVWTVAGVVLLTAGALRGVGVVERFVADRDRPAREAFDDAFSVGIMFGVIVAAIVAAAAPLLAWAYDDPRLLLALLAVAAIVLTDGLKFPVWWHYRELRFGTQRALMLTDAFASVLFALPLLAWGWEYWGLIAGAGLASAFTIVVVWVVGPQPRLRRPTKDTIRRYAVFGGPILGFALVAIVTSHLGYLSVRHAEGLVALGFLGIAGLPYVASERLISVLNQSVYPALVRRGDASREAAVEAMSRIGWALLAPLLLGVAALAPFAIPRLLGAAWETAGILMSVVAIGSVIHLFGYPFAVVVMSTGKTKAIARFAALFVACAAFLVIPTTLLFGLEGYCVTILVTEAILAAERWRIVREALPGANLLRDLGEDLLIAALPALGAGAAILATPDMDGGFRVVLAAILALPGVVAVVVRQLPFARTMIAGIRGRPAAEPPSDPLVLPIMPQGVTAA